MACRAQPCAKRYRRTESTAQATIFATFGDMETSLERSRQWPAVRSRAQSADNVATTLRRPRFWAIFVHLDGSRRGRKKLTRVASRTNAHARGQKSSKNTAQATKFRTFGSSRAVLRTSSRRGKKGTKKKTLAAEPLRGPHGLPPVKPAVKCVRTVIYNVFCAFHVLDNIAQNGALEASKMGQNGFQDGIT